MAAWSPNKSYLSLIVELSQELSSEEAKGVAFLCQVSPSRYKPKCCCGGNGALELLEILQEKEVFSHGNMDPLASLLEEVGRHDLASKCRQLPAPLPQLCTQDSGRTELADIITTDRSAYIAN